MVRLYSKKQVSNPIGDTGDMVAVQNRRNDGDSRRKVRNLRKLQEEYNLLRY